MPGKQNTVGFTYEVDNQYTGKMEYISVTAKVYPGTTRSGGDDPADVEVVECRDASGNSCWHLLSPKDQDCILEAAYELSY